jgi:hypothetical protein
MTARVWLLVLAGLVAPFAANAQITLSSPLTLSTLSGTTLTPVTTSYNFASIAPNTTETVTFVASNTAATPVTITTLALSGIGFAIVNTSTPPYVIAPGNSFDFTVRFTGGPVGNYSANLQVNTMLVALQGTVVQAGTLTVASPCTGPDSQGNIGFGRVPQTQQVTCTFTLANPYTQALTVSPIALAGAAFQTAQASSATIPAGQSISFQVIFTAATANAYTGTLIVGVQTYYLTGTGYLSPLPAPILSFNASVLQSGTQYALTASLPSPAQAAAYGTITMGFSPSTSAVTDDTTVEFVATSNRVMPFSVAQGSSAMLLNNQLDATFSTGTTAGTIAFTVDAGAIGIGGNATTTATIAPAPVAVTAASATNETATLDVSVTGYDNTYSIGAMTFTFYDLTGKPLGSPIQANFTTQFQVFYQSQTSESPASAGVSAGSAFLMLVSFPVTGNGALVGSVSVQLNNTAGTTTVQGLEFP